MGATEFLGFSFLIFAFIFNDFMITHASCSLEALNTEGKLKNMWHDHQQKCIPSNFPLLNCSGKIFKLSWKSQGKLREFSFSKKCGPLKLRELLFQGTLLVPLTKHHLISFKCGFLNIFSRQNLLPSLSRLLFLLRCNKNGAKNVWKPHSIRLLRWFNFSQSGSRKNNRKAFEGASMEPTNFTFSLPYDFVVLPLFKKLVIY